MQEVKWEDLKLVRRLGSGSFKDVWAGTWQGEEVAIGVLRDVSQLRPPEVDEFRTEAKILSNLRHPKILHVWGICPVLPNLAIVTELCSTDLYRYLHVDATQITVSQALELMTGIALGLSYLHGKKIAHRDLKSPNVLLTSTGSVKLGDFGLATVKQSSRSLRTQVGTPLWMAPEVIKNEPYDLSADVYSLGLIFYEILTGKLPYDGLNQMQLLMHVVMQGKRPDIDTDLRLDVPIAVTNMIKLCWDANPVRRPKIDQVLQVLNHAEDQLADAGASSEQKLGLPQVIHTMQENLDFFGSAREEKRRPEDPSGTKELCALGNKFYHGQGVAKDLTEAARLYRLAADQGHANAQCNLGVCYENGRGVAKDLTEAARLYRLAADQGLARAQSNLGFFYDNGQGVAKDLTEAVRLYRLAADQGHANAQSALNKLS